MVAAHSFKTFKKLLASYLAIAGFSSEGDSYWRHIRGTLIIFEIQKDRKRSSASEVVFTINVGISIDALRNTDLGLHNNADVPQSGECHWRIRLGRLLPVSKDIWWSVYDEKTAQIVFDEITLGLIEYAFPKIYAMASSEELISAWQSGRGQGLTEYERRANLAKLLCISGRFKEARVAIRELEDASIGRPWEISAKRDIAVLQAKFQRLANEDFGCDQ